MSGDDAGFVKEFFASVFPTSPAGVNFDVFVSNADVTNYNLEAISAPTTPQMTSLPLTKRVSTRLSASPTLDLSASNYVTKQIKPAVASTMTPRHASTL